MFAFATALTLTWRNKRAAREIKDLTPRHRPKFTVCCNYEDRLSNIQLPRTMTTSTEKFRDARGIEWDFEMDVLDSSVSYLKQVEKNPIIFSQPPDALGSTRFYWDRVLSVLAENPSWMSYHNIVRFDWIGASGTRSQTKQIPAPTTPDILAAQLAYVASKFDKPVIVVGQGGAEPVLLKFAHAYPDLVKACSVSTGFPTAFITREANPMLRKTVYALLCSFLGRLFWNYASSRDFITSFTKKNLFRTDEWLNEWVYRVTRAAKDQNSRFLTFSGLSGHFFGDFRKELAEIRTPWLFLAGSVDPTSNENRLQRPNDFALMRSKKERYKETNVDRGNERWKLMRKCQTAVVEGAGVQMLFEDVEITLPEIVKFVNDQCR